MTLFERPEECCGCAACREVCPKTAITMTADGFGFVYPQIDGDKCIDCGLCEKVCPIKSELPSSSENAPAYAAVTKDGGLLERSSSGGVFALLAKEFIGRGGVVFGSALINEKGSLKPRHIAINNVDELWRVQGSKYVQSDISVCFKEIKELLGKGIPVLFSGTPCQVAAVKGFMSKDADKLYTIDLVCHGVPSEMMFNDYLRSLEKKHDGKIHTYNFRDKTVAWGRGKAVFTLKNGNEKVVPIYPRTNPYLSLFQSGYMYRTSCYNCRFAGLRRPGDITIGDFWGIENEHPEYLKENGGMLEIRKGISCIIVNTENGETLINEFGKDLQKFSSTPAAVARNNAQLVQSSAEPSDNGEIMKGYASEGWSAAEKAFKKKLGARYYLYSLYYKIKG